MPPSLDARRVLLDECLPRKLKREFAGCEVFTVPEMGWSGKKNGALMQVAREHSIYSSLPIKICVINKTCLTPELQLSSWSLPITALKTSCHR